MTRQPSPEPRTAIRIKVYGGSLSLLSLLPPGTVWRIEQITDHFAPGGLIGEVMPEWTIIDLSPTEAAAGPAMANEGAAMTTPAAPRTAAEQSVASGRRERGLRPLAFRMRTFAAARSQDGEEATASVVEGWAEIVEQAAIEAEAAAPAGLPDSQLDDLLRALAERNIYSRADLEAAAPAGLDVITAEHRKCGPVYEGCYAHWPMEHCRADGMAWPCDVEHIARLLRGRER